ncbi:hypothetical protein [Stenotrophomonas cyclobalanopsidis]|uniref:hypothetical protein n=1 Tax=Stenotrophomonas cyclobalanopsidis TaxID=2771362 RepID=UPI002FDAE18D
MDLQESVVVHLLNLLEKGKCGRQLRAEQLMFRDLDQIRILLTFVIPQIACRCEITEGIKHP